MEVQLELGRLKKLYKQSINADREGKDTTINPCSDKQMDYLNILWDRTLLDNSSKLSFYSDALNRKLESIGDVVYSDVGKLITSLKKKIRINNKQIEFVKKVVPDISELSRLCKRNINSYGDVSIWEMHMITKYNPNFNFERFLDNFKLKINQSILEANEDWEYGKQMAYKTNTDSIYFMKFNQMVMLDFDNIDLEGVLEKLNIIKNIEGEEGTLFRIYQTYNGYHVFIISHVIEYYSLKTAYLMKLLGCDPWYIAFSYKYGFRVRLSIKEKRDEKYVRRWIGDYSVSNNPDKILFPHPHCKMLIQKLEQYTKKHLP
jgi:hypothetical protein